MGCERGGLVASVEAGGDGKRDGEKEEGMARFQRSFRYLPVLPVAAAMAVALVSGVSPQESRAPERISAGIVSDDVAPAAAAAARRLAEDQAGLKAASMGGRVVFVGVELVREKLAGDETRVLYQTVHYSYPGNATIYTTVDLEAKAVRGVREAKNVPTPISEEEFAEARALALADPAIRELLGQKAERVAVEALGLYTTDPGDPVFGHRAMSLFFREGDTYLANVDVTVDLTSRKVTVTRNETRREEMKP